MTVNTVTRSTKHSIQRLPAEPSGAFIEAIEDAYENLSRRGINPITPFDLWARMELTGQMEGTLTDIVAWDAAHKAGKSYVPVITQLLKDRKCRYLLLERQSGQDVVTEEIPF